MANGVNVAAWEGGELRIMASREVSREVVLAVPLSRLIVRILRVPDEERADPVAYATPLLQALSPYPDEPLSVSCETVSEAETSITVLAVAFPESANEDIAEALDGRKLNVTRVDSLALGALRGLWGAVMASGEPDARRLVLLGGADCLSAFVLDGDQPVALRAISLAADLRREVMLSLLEAEDFAGPRALSEIVVTGPVEAGALADFAPLRRLEIGEDAALVGVAERSEESGTFNALPASWREVLEETRFKAKLAKALCVAGGLWALLMLVLFGVPVVYGVLESRQKTFCKEHAKAYRSVLDMKMKTELVRKYSDHSTGALEIMKALSDRLPQGVTLLSWNYKRGEGVKVSGEADTAELVYQFKDSMASVETLAGEDRESYADAQRLFKAVELTGPSARGTKQKFDLDCRFASGEEAEE